MSEKSDTVKDVVGADEVVVDDQSVTANVPASLISTKNNFEHSSSSKIDGHLPTNDLDRAPPLNGKEQKALKMARYEERHGSFTNEFLLEHGSKQSYKESLNYFPMIQEWEYRK